MTDKLKEQIKQYNVIKNDFNDNQNKYYAILKDCEGNEDLMDEIGNAYCYRNKKICNYKIGSCKKCIFRDYDFYICRYKKFKTFRQVDLYLQKLEKIINRLNKKIEKEIKEETK